MDFAAKTNHLLLELTDRYCEPGRFYHTLVHIAHMLHAGREFPITDTQKWAIWFHDAIYDPRSSTNEEDSAQLAESRLSEMGLPDRDVDAVASIVRDTATHVATSEAAAAVIDLDLSSLALPWPAFEANRMAIRKEYLFVSDEDFAQSTRELFLRFLDRPRLFVTSWGQRLEPSARSNIERSLGESRK